MHVDILYIPIGIDFTLGGVVRDHIYAWSALP